jgi:Asp-tRNA(Asn)/Glu-tRNA(Gln) amidotransferase A subunit family amidase
MNLPWTLVGFPAITIPTTSQTDEGLPFGFQCSAAFMQDERLLQWSRRLAQVMTVPAS